MVETHLLNILSASFTPLCTLVGIKYEFLFVVLNSSYLVEFISVDLKSEGVSSINLCHAMKLLVHPGEYLPLWGLLGPVYVVFPAASEVTLHRAVFLQKSSPELKFHRFMQPQQSAASLANSDVQEP